MYLLTVQYNNANPYVAEKFFGTQTCLNRCLEGKVEVFSLTAETLGSPMLTILRDIGVILSMA